VVRAYLTLADIAAKTDRLVVACSRCERRCRYSLARLIAKYGPDKSGVELLRELSADCPLAGNVVEGNIIYYALKSFSSASAIGFQPINQAYMGPLP
jgi:hypothetical protein